MKSMVWGLPLKVAILILTHVYGERMVSLLSRPAQQNHLHLSCPTLGLRLGLSGDNVGDLNMFSQLYHTPQKFYLLAPRKLLPYLLLCSHH